MPCLFHNIFLNNCKILYKIFYENNGSHTIKKFNKINNTYIYKTQINTNKNIVNVIKNIKLFYRNLSLTQIINDTS